MWLKGALIHCWWGYKLGEPLWKTVWRVLKKIISRKEWPYDLSIPLWGIYMKNTKTLIQKDIWTPTFIMALFTTAKIGGKAQVTINRWTDKDEVVYIQWNTCCSVVKSCLTPCDSMNCSTSGFSVHHYLCFLKLMSIVSVMPSNHLILYCPLLLLPSIFPSIRVFSSESALHIRWPKYWSFSFSFSISPFNE